MPHRLITAGYVAVIAAAGWAVNHASEERSEQKLRALEHACAGTGNPARALDQLDAPTVAARHRREKWTPLLDCHATYFENEGRPVALSLNQQRVYVLWLRRGIRPVIRPDGSVSPK